MKILVFLMVTEIFIGSVLIFDPTTEIFQLDTQLTIRYWPDQDRP